MSREPKPYTRYTLTPEQFEAIKAGRVVWIQSFALDTFVYDLVMVQPKPVHWD